MEETSSYSPKEILLSHKLTIAYYHTSFYFWLTLASTLVALFSTRIYDSSSLLRNAFGETLPQYVILLMGVAVGLFLWRYHVNRAYRVETFKAMEEEFGADDPDRARFAKAFTEAHKRNFAIFLRVRSTCLMIAIVESILCISRLVSASAFTDIFGVYFVIISVAVVGMIGLSIASNLIAKKSFKTLAKEINTSTTVA